MNWRQPLIWSKTLEPSDLSKRRRSTLMLTTPVKRSQEHTNLPEGQIPEVTNCHQPSIWSKTLEPSDHSKRRQSTPMLTTPAKRSQEHMNSPKGQSPKFLK
jgi:hypothetical protein